MTRLRLIIATVLLLSCFAHARGSSQTLIGTGPTGVVQVDPWRRVTTLVSLVGGAQGIAVEAGNNGVVVGSGRAVLLVQNRRATTMNVLPLGATVNDILVDQDGTYVIASSADRTLYRMQPSAPYVLRTFARTGRAITRIERDFDTGDFLLLDDTHVYTADRASGALSTLFSTRFTFDGARDLVYLAPTGNIAVAGGKHVYLVDRAGSVISRVMVGGAYGLVLNRLTSALHATGGDRPNTTSQIDLGVSSFASTPLPGVTLRQIVLAQSRTAVGAGSANPGQDAYVSFSLEPNATFVGAVALSCRPCLRFGSGFQAIAPDGLFLATVARDLPLTSGFIGRTDPAGKHTMRFTIHPAVPRGTVFYAAGSTVVPRPRDGHRYAKTVCIKVE